MKKNLRSFLALLTITSLMLTACSSRLGDGQTELPTPPPEPSSSTSSQAIPPLVESSVVENNLADSPVNLSDMIMQTSAAISDLNLTISQTFAIARPTEKISTTFETYFITGTSDPASPVYFGSTEIVRQGTLGTFGVHVPLTLGSNTFSFSQGDQKTSITIVRNQKAGVIPISKLNQESIYPAVMGGVKVGQNLLVECTAPSGGNVSATFDGKTVQLTQKTQTATGVPTTFQGAILIDGDYPSDVTTKAGKIAYTLTYNGSTSNYESTGDVYVAGANSYIAVAVTSYMGFLQSDPTNPAVFREQLKQGSTDYVKNQTNRFYELNSGGYLPVSQAKIIEGVVGIGNKISSVDMAVYEKSEIYTFSGTSAPAFFSKQGDGTFSLTLFNSSGTPSADVSSSRLFSSSSAIDNGGSVTYTFTIKSGSLWGYHIFHDGTTTYLRCAYKPKISGDSLSGVTVVLDPGHGGYENGALGVAGKNGPSEATINLAHTLAAKESLENMGAKVLVTRTDTYISLDDRLRFFDASGADIFISLHHNSLAESTDANKVAGMEVYYHTPLSKNFAESLMGGMATNLNRNNRKVQQNYYRVTLSTYAPSLLFELAYISNPFEYERSVNRTNIQQAGQALAESVRSALR